jgi:hypothetical protein
MQRRNKNDFRINRDYIYTEKHHITPKHANGLDEEDNYIILLPEEHLFIHKLRWKAYKERGDMLAVRYIINGINNKTQKKERFDELKLNIPKKLFQAFTFIKQNSSEVRKTHGWQSIDGRKRISEAMKNKLVCRDAETGELVGKHDKCHPNIISGKWVHHSKGKFVSDEIRAAQSIKGSGSGNNNANPLSTEEILDLCLDVTLEYGSIRKTSLIRQMIIDKYSIKIPSTGLGYRVKNPTKYTIKWLEKQTGWAYDPYYNNRLQKERNDKN